MAVKKKVKPTTKSKVSELAKQAEGFMKKDAKKDAPEKETPAPATKPKSGHRVPVLVVVQAKDGKWLYGDQGDESKLIATKHGKYNSSADASEAATKDGDIVINTGPAPETKAGKGWGQLSVPAHSKSGTSGDKAAPLKDGVSLKKVCDDAGIDPKLARRILRAKVQKPGGRWEWSKAEAPGIVKLLKEAAAAEAKKGSK